MKVRRITNGYVVDKEEARTWGYLSMGASAVATVMVVLCVVQEYLCSLVILLWSGFLALLILPVTSSAGYLMGWLWGIMVRRRIGVCIVALLAVALIVEGSRNLRVERHGIFEVYEALGAAALFGLTIVLSVGATADDSEEFMKLVLPDRHGPADHALACLVLGGLWLWLTVFPPAWRDAISRKRAMLRAAQPVLDRIRSLGYEVYVDVTKDGAVTITATNWKCAEPYAAYGTDGDVYEAACELAKQVGIDEARQFHLLGSVRSRGGTPSRDHGGRKKAE